LDRPPGAFGVVAERSSRRRRGVAAARCSCQQSSPWGSGDSLIYTPNSTPRATPRAWRSQNRSPAANGDACGERLSPGRRTAPSARRQATARITVSFRSRGDGDSCPLQGLRHQVSLDTARESWVGQRLCENVCGHLLGRNVLDIDPTEGNQLPYVVIPYVNVLRPAVGHWIRSNRQAGLVVAEELDLVASATKQFPSANLMEQGAKPLSLLGGFAESDILGFSCRRGDAALLRRSPADRPPIQHKNMPRDRVTVDVIPCVIRVAIAP
jgi:hypothetical protein